MKFCVLGPLEVSSNGAPLPLGGAKPRALLAALLLRRGEVVSTDHLARAVWGATPPHDAVGTLQAYVSRLRSSLGHTGADLLRYRAPGYVLNICEDDLDAAQFTRLVAQGLKHAERGQRQAAVDLLGEALALWRGEPLAEFDTVRIDPDGLLARLEELRLVAIEEKAASLVRLGRGREVAAELEPLLRRFPTRERLAVVMMEALYGCGRQADALSVYRTLRTYLVDEIGVEPSEPARQAHLRLLAQDPTLVMSGSVGHARLPKPRSALVGRRAELSRMSTTLARAPLVTLTGVGGVGKTRLALEVASREQRRFSDGAWWCELAPVRETGRVSHAVAATLRVQQRPGSTMEDTLLDYLSDRQTLIVLDNCEHLLAETAQLVDLILTRCPGVVVLATSRESLSTEGEEVFPVAPLLEEDAVSLFVQRAQAGGTATDPGRVDPTSVMRICQHLEGLPLAIELAAARTRAMSAAEVLSRIDDQGLLVRQSPTRAARQMSLTATIDWSYRLLTLAEQRLFTRLSVFAGGADLEAVHAVCGEDRATETSTLDLLTALVDKSMVVVMTGPGDTRYRVLEMLRAYGHALLASDGMLSRRHAQYFTHLAERAAREVQGPQEVRCIDRTLPDADNLRVAFEHAVELHDADLALRLSSALPEVLQLRLGYESAEWAQRALDLAEPDHPRYVATVGAAARGAWNMGEFVRARRLAESALGVVPPPGTARTGYPGDVLADIALYEGDVETTMRHYSGAVVSARADGDAIRLVWALYYVAICHAVQRHPELGVPIADECLEVAERTENPTARSMARYALGLVLKKADPSRAVGLFDVAAELAGTAQNFWWEGIAMMEAAATRAVHDDPELAGRALIDVVDHWQRVGDRTQLWLSLRYVVRLLRRLGADEAALTLHHYLLAEGKASPIDPESARLLLGESDDARLSVATSRGRAMSLTQALTFAKSSLRSS